MRDVVCLFLAFVVIFAMLSYTARAAVGGDPVDDPIEEPEDLSLGESGEGETAADPDILQQFIEALTEFGVFSIPEDNNYPANAPLAGGLYMQADTAQLGQVLIYIPIDFQKFSFTFDSSGNLVNLRSSTITGFMYRGSTLYDIRWTSLQTATYRTSGTGTYVALTIRSILNTNVNIVERNEDIPVVPISEMYQLIAIFLLGVIAICLFMRRL